MAANKWIELVKSKYAEVKKEGKIKGRAIMKEAIARAKKEYKAAKV